MWCSGKMGWRNSWVVEKSITQMALKQFFFISAFRNPLHFTDTQYQIKVTNGCHQLWVKHPSEPSHIKTMTSHFPSYSPRNNDPSLPHLLFGFLEWTTELTLPDWDVKPAHCLSRREAGSVHSVVPAPSLELLSLCQYCVSLKLLIGWCNGETFPSRENLQ